MQAALKNFTRNLDFYQNYLPNQTFKFESLFDAYDEINALWKERPDEYKYDLIEISFKAIIEDINNGKEIRIVKMPGTSYYNRVK